MLRNEYFCNYKTTSYDYKNNIYKQSSVISISILGNKPSIKYLCRNINSTLKL